MEIAIRLPLRYTVRSIQCVSAKAGPRSQWGGIDMFEALRKEHAKNLQAANNGYGTGRDKFLFAILLLIVEAIITVGEEIVTAIRQDPLL